MNILKRELKANLKTFIFWSIGLFVLAFAGMTKYTGLSGGEVNVDQLLAHFPRILQAMFGMVGVDISTLQGYYAVLVFYTMICIAIYGISLGANAVGREAIDKTYEFIFTKPRSRSYVLGMKLSAGIIYLLLFGLLNYIFSIGAIGILKLDVDISKEVALFSISVVLIGILFYTMSAFIVSLIKRAEKGFLYGNLCFAVLFIIGMIYDMLEDAEVLRVFTPLKYFTPAEILDGKLNPGFLFLTTILCITFTIFAFVLFEKKNLQAGN